MAASQEHLGREQAISMAAAAKLDELGQLLSPQNRKEPADMNPNDISRYGQ